jgi:predicted O-methyltransferase YrrM
MSTKNELYVMRGEYTNGLLSLIDYINQQKSTKELSMIEIGSYAGESTTMFANHFKKVVSVDPFLNDYDANDIACQYMDLTKVYDTFKSAISSYSNITHIRKISDDAINDLKDNSFDFVYIDGLHTYEQVKKDISNYLPKIKDGGFIGGHDYHPVWQGVVNAINENFTIDAIFSDTSWIVRKNK